MKLFVSTEVRTLIFSFADLELGLVLILRNRIICVYDVIIAYTLNYVTIAGSFSLRNSREMYSQTNVEYERSVGFENSDVTSDKLDLVSVADDTRYALTCEHVT